MVQNGATRDGERDGEAILCADTGHNCGRLVLALVATVSLNENMRERASQFSFFFEQSSNRNGLEPRFIKTKCRHNIVKAACGTYRRRFSAFEDNHKKKTGHIS
jgi:hypothetical protein